MSVHDHHPRDELQRLAKAISRKRIWLRFQAVILALPGRSAPDIARALGCRRRAVPAWVARYNRGGVPALHERPHPGRPPRLAGPERRRFAERLEAGPRPEAGVGTRRGRVLRRILTQAFDVTLGRQAVSDRLHRRAFASLMPRPQPPGAHEEVPAFFPAIVVAPIDALAAAHPETEVPVWFADEARFGQPGTIPRVWARRGSRPRAVRPPGRVSLSALAAVGVATGAVAALLVPGRDIEGLNAFWEPSTREWPAGVHAVLIGDGAGDHTGVGLRVPENISLIPLPPDSPELNPVENRWH